MYKLVLQADDTEFHNNIISIINYLNSVDSIGLNRVYTTLFISGGYGKIICPYVSMYLGSSGHVMAQERYDIMEIYSKNILFLTDEFKEQEDNIAAMLSHIYFTCKDISKNNILNESTIDFLLDFIKKYVIQLLYKLIDEFYNIDTSLLYYHISKVIKTYLIYDFELDTK